MMGEIFLEKDLFVKVKDILNAYENNESDLLAILLEIQNSIPQQYIPKEVAKFVSEQLKIPLSRVYDVITFYSAFSDKPRGRYVIQICNGIACKVNKYTTLKDILEEQLGIKVGETTPDGNFTLIYTSCIGACDISPVFRIGEDVYGNLTEERVKEIIEDYRRR